MTHPLPGTVWKQWSTEIESNQWKTPIQCPPLPQLQKVLRQSIHARRGLGFSKQLVAQWGRWMLQEKDLRNTESHFGMSSWPSPLVKEKQRARGCQRP